LGKVTITKASTEMVRVVVPLFDAYRQFYEEPSDLEGAKNFLVERLRRGESVIFLAWEGGQCVGFAQLYPSFSSSSMKRIWILNDLFVLSSARGHGVGRALLEQSKLLAIESGAKELTLETAKNNLTAQRLYEGCGWKRDDVFYKYNLAV
jgi:GNAT superfamily N-acetyltransferase